ncbi:hypothetical protein B484DRAFT_441472 [Ochromonadaceae sp. CCMP2298]|nr:hypothetical protein B484DRAFT_441472 [Ochromonadaceae sp. CCMP2298]
MEGVGGVGGVGGIGLVGGSAAVVDPLSHSASASAPVQNPPGGKGGAGGGKVGLGKGTSTSTSTSTSTHTSTAKDAKRSQERALSRAKSKAATPTKPTSTGPTSGLIRQASRRINSFMQSTRRRGGDAGNGVTSRRDPRTDEAERQAAVRRAESAAEAQAQEQVALQARLITQAAVVNVSLYDLFVSARGGFNDRPLCSDRLWEFAAVRTTGTARTVRTLCSQSSKLLNETVKALPSLQNLHSALVLALFQERYRPRLLEGGRGSIRGGSGGIRGGTGGEGGGGRTGSNKTNSTGPSSSTTNNNNNNNIGNNSSRGLSPPTLPSPSPSRGRRGSRDTSPIRGNKDLSPGRPPAAGAMNPPSRGSSFSSNGSERTTKRGGGGSGRGGSEADSGRDSGRDSDSDKSRSSRGSDRGRGGGGGARGSGGRARGRGKSGRGSGGGGRDCVAVLQGLFRIGFARRRVRGMVQAASEQRAREQLREMEVERLLQTYT